MLGPVTHNGQAAGDGDVDEEEEEEGGGGGGGVEDWSQTGKSQAGCASLRGGGGLKESLIAIRQLFPPRLRRDEDLQQPTPSAAKSLLMTRQLSLIQLTSSCRFQHVSLVALLPAQTTRKPPVRQRAAVVLIRTIPGSRRR